jgi:hypothetical protein
MLKICKRSIDKYLGLSASSHISSLVRSPSLFRAYMYEYAAAGGTHTYTHIAQSTAAGEATNLFSAFIEAEIKAYVSREHHNCSEEKTCRSYGALIMFYYYY